MRRGGQGQAAFLLFGVLVGGVWLASVIRGWGQAPVATLAFSANTSRVALGGILRVDLATANPTPGAVADLYAAVLVPGGGLVFRRADATFSVAPGALAPEAPVATRTIPIVNLPLPESLAAGTYTFLAAYVRAGTPADLEALGGNRVSSVASLDVVIGPATVSFRNQVRPIFNANCALSGCHVPPFPAGGQDLATDPYREILGRTALELFLGRALPRIDPGRPDNSYIIQKLLGTPGIEGVRMPFGRAPLPPALIDTIRTWIAEGAPNN
jgi:hypothetical protein